MRLRYTLTRWDLFRAGLRAILHQRILLICLIPFLTFIGWSSYTYEKNQELALPARVTVAMFTAALCAGGGFVAAALTLAAQSVFRKDTGILGVHTLEITNDGLVESTEVNRSLANWRTLFRIRETSHYFYIYISLGHGYVIPKARAPLEGSVSDFLDELRARITKFQQNAPPNGGLATQLGGSGAADGPPSVS